MSRRRKIVAAAFMVLVVGLVLRGVYLAFFGPPVITIVNKSQYALSDVVLKGDPFSRNVQQILPGKSRSVVVYPLGESGLEIEFNANDRHMAKDDLAYIEASGGYCVTLVIDAQFEVHSTDGGFCFALRRAV